MKRKIKFFSVFMTLIMVLTSTYVSFASDISREDYLIGKGFPSDFVHELTEEQLNYIYENSYGENKKLSSIEFQTITEENDQTTRNTIYPTTMELTVINLNVVTEINGKERIDSVTVMFLYTWNKFPKVHWTDMMTANWDTSVFTYKPDSFLLDCYGKYSSGTSEIYHQTDTLAASTQGSIGWDIPLKWIPFYDTFWGLGGFELLPADGPIYDMEGYSTTNINVEYSHDKNVTSKSLTWEISYIVGVASNVEFDTAATSAVVAYKKE